MNSSLQTLISLGIVLIAAALLLRSWFGKKKPGCASEGCSAVSPEIKKLQKRLKR